MLILPVRFPTVAGGVSTPAQSSQSVADRLGVQIHMPFSTTTYSDVAQVKALVSDLGVKHVRDTHNLTWTGSHAKLIDVAQTCGVKVTLGSRMADDISSWVSEVASTYGSLGILEAIEGANEQDASGGSWVANTRAHQQALYPAVKGTPSLAALPVLAPALANGVANSAALGDLSAYCDKANTHIYSGQRPSNGIASYSAAALTVAGAKPVVVTETGYHNAFNDPDTSMQTVSESAAGVYGPRFLLEHVLAGTERVFMYELLDQANDAGVDIQNNYGLVRYDYTKKPIFDSIKALLTTLNDPGASYSPSPLTLSITPPVGNTDLRSLLVGKRDGSYRLLLWRDVSIWNPNTEVDVSVSAINVDVAWPGGGTSVSIAGSLQTVVIPA